MATEKYQQLSERVEQLSKEVVRVTTENAELKFKVAKLAERLDYMERNITVHCPPTPTPPERAPDLGDMLL